MWQQRERSENFNSRLALLDDQDIHINYEDNSSPQTFRDLIKSITTLKDKGYLNDSDFTDLVTIACSRFIQSAVERRVNDVLYNKFHKIFERMPDA